MHDENKPSIYREGNKFVVNVGNDIKGLKLGLIGAISKRHGGKYRKGTQTFEFPKASAAMSFATDVEITKMKDDAKQKVYRDAKVADFPVLKYLFDAGFKNKQAADTLDFIKNMSNKQRGLFAIESLLNGYKGDDAKFKKAQNFLSKLQKGTSQNEGVKNAYDRVFDMLYGEEVENGETLPALTAPQTLLNFADSAETNRKSVYNDRKSAENDKNQQSSQENLQQNNSAETKKANTGEQDTSKATGAEKFYQDWREENQSQLKNPEIAKLDERANKLLKQLDAGKVSPEAAKKQTDYILNGQQKIEKTPEQIKKSLADLAQKAWSDNNYKETVSFTPSQKFRDKAQEIFGHDVNTVFLTANETRHIRNQHGQNENQRGQIDIKPENISDIYDIVNDFDVAEQGKTNEFGEKSIELTKNSLADESYVITVERGKKRAVIKSSYKKKKAQVSNAQSPEQNVQNVPDATSSADNIPQKQDSDKEISEQDKQQSAIYSYVNELHKDDANITLGEVKSNLEKLIGAANVEKFSDKIEKLHRQIHSANAKLGRLKSAKKDKSDETAKAESDLKNIFATETQEEKTHADFTTGEFTNMQDEKYFGAFITGERFLEKVDSKDLEKLAEKHNGSFSQNNRSYEDIKSKGVARFETAEDRDAFLQDAELDKILDKEMYRQSRKRGERQLAEYEEQERQAKIQREENKKRDTYAKLVKQSLNDEDLTKDERKQIVEDRDLLSIDDTLRESLYKKFPNLQKFIDRLFQAEEKGLKPDYRYDDARKSLANLVAVPKDNVEQIYKYAAQGLYGFWSGENDTHGYSAKAESNKEKQKAARALLDYDKLSAQELYAKMLKLLHNRVEKNVKNSAETSQQKNSSETEEKNADDKVEVFSKEKGNIEEGIKAVFKAPDGTFIRCDYSDESTRIFQISYRGKRKQLLEQRKNQGYAGSGWYDAGSTMRDFQRLMGDATKISANISARKKEVAEIQAKEKIINDALATDDNGEIKKILKNNGFNIYSDTEKISEGLLNLFTRKPYSQVLDTVINSLNKNSQSADNDKNKRENNKVKFSGKGELTKMFRNARQLSENELNGKQKKWTEFANDYGLKIVWLDAHKDLKGAVEDGIIYLNANANKDISKTFYHEQFHILSALNPELHAEIINYFNGKDGFTKQQLDNYWKENQREDLTDIEVVEEILSDNFEQVQSRVKLLQDMAKDNPSLLKKFINFVKNLADKFVSIFRSPEGGMTRAQRDDFIQKFNKLAGSLKDIHGNKIFTTYKDGKGLRFANGDKLLDMPLQFSAENSVDNQQDLNDNVQDDDETAENEILKRLENQSLIRQITDDMDIGEVREKLLRPENIAVGQALKIYERLASSKNVDKTKLNDVRNGLKEAVLYADELRRQFQQFETLQACARSLQRQNKGRKGSRLAESFQQQLDAGRTGNLTG